MATLLVGATPAEPAAPARARAAAHFEQGLARLKEGDIAGARREFDLAYLASPHYSTLLNLGQAHAALGNPVEAVDCLRRYLDGGKDRLDPARRSAAEDLIRQQERHIGSIQVEVVPEGATILLDGKVLGAAPLQVPIRAKEGHHGLVVRHEGMSPYSEPVEVTAGATTRLSVSLTPERETRGQLLLSCPIPDVTLTVNGKVQGSFSTVVTPGPHVARFERSGYLSHEVTVHVPTGGIGRATCKLRPAAGQPHHQGSLSLAGLPPEADVLLDGAPFAERPLPSGRHRLVVSLTGFHPWSREVVVPPKGVRKVQVSLIPTPQHRRELLQQERRRNTVALTLTVAGAGVVAAGATLYYWNGKRYDEWRGERDAAYASWQSSPTSQGVVRISTVEARSAGIQQVDDIAFGLAIAGGAALVSGVVLWLTGDGPITEAPPGK